MSYSVSEAKKIVNQYGTAFKIYYREIIGLGSLRLEDMENSFNNAFVGEFNNRKEIVDYYLDSMGAMSELSRIKILNCDLSHFLDYDLLFGELEHYYYIILCSDTGIYYVFNL
jgi:antirestriction protein